MVAIAEGARLFRETEAGYDSSVEATGIYPGFDPLGLNTFDDDVKIMREKVLADATLCS